MTPERYEMLDRFEKAEYLRRRIISYLRKNANATTPEIIFHLGVSKAMAHKVMVNMLNRGELSRTSTSSFGGGMVYLWRAEKDTIKAEEVKETLTHNLRGKRPVYRLFGGL